MTTKELFEPIQQALRHAIGEGKWLLAGGGLVAVLQLRSHRVVALDPAAVRSIAAAAAMKLPHVARVYTRDQLPLGEVADDRVGSRVLRGFNQQRSGDLEIILEPYWMRQAPGHDAWHSVQLRCPHPAHPDGLAHPCRRVLESRRTQRSGTDTGHAVRSGNSERIGRARADRGDSSARDYLASSAVRDLTPHDVASAQRPSPVPPYSSFVTSSGNPGNT